MEITQNEKQIINYLKKNPNSTLAEIAKNLKKNKSSIFYQLDSLVDKQIITKLDLPDENIYYKLENEDELRNRIKTEISKLESTLLKQAPTDQPDTETKKPKLVFSDEYVLPQNMLDKLSNKYEITTFPNSPTYISKELFLHRCQDAEIIINFFSTQLTAEILAKCKNLKTIVSPALSLGFIDQKACKKLGIQTISLDIEKNYKRSARREFVIAALFSLLRPIHTATQDIKMGRFKYSDFNAQEIGGKKIGIVGTKREGKAIIDILRAFGTAIFIANPDNPSACPTELGVNEFVTLEELFEQTDIVVFPEEYNHELDITPFLSKKDIPQYLLFLSATVEYDLDKLRELIIQKTLSGIFIDYFPEIFKVFKDFPNSQYRKIMNFPNVVITPEIGFYTEESMRENYNQVFKILSQL